MSQGISVADASGTPVCFPQRSVGRREPWRIRSRSVARVAPPDESASGTLTLELVTTIARGTIYPRYSDPGSTVVQPVYILEIKKSRSLTSTSEGKEYTRTFYIHGSSDPLATKDIGPQPGDLDDEDPSFVATKRDAKPVGWGGGEGDIVQVDVSYQTLGFANNSADDAVETTFSYDFTTESEHIDRAIVQVHYGGDASRISDLINVDDDSVNGIDIGSPVVEITEERWYSEAGFSPSFRRQLADHVMQTNAARFREYNIGEVLFVGAQAKKVGRLWQVMFNFRVRRNQRDIPITTYSIVGGRTVATVQSVVKLGWQYLWIESRHFPQVADPTKIMIAPYAVHVATVYESMNFAGFGIGTAPLR